jgi:predicted RNA-binding Zn-ribbon protein involved in translation (DUF1610 family)
MTAPKLVLHPCAPWIPAAAPATLLRALQDLGFVGAAFDLDGRRHYRTGPAFLDHVSFLGCAPSIELDPPATEPEAAARAGRFCHIHLQTQVTPPQLRLRPGQRPRCRSCRGEIDPAALAGTEITCPACGHLSTRERLNWRQSGGCAGLFLDIWGIHIAEAVPGDRLLDRLGQSSGCPWVFFYIED